MAGNSVRNLPRVSALVPDGDVSGIHTANGLVARSWDLLSYVLKAAHIKQALGPGMGINNRTASRRMPVSDKCAQPRIIARDYWLGGQATCHSIDV